MVTVGFAKTLSPPYAYLPEAAIAATTTDDEPFVAHAAAAALSAP